MSVQEGVKSACLPCAVGHFSTSSSLLNEAVRFKKDGLASTQVLDDIAQAIGEQNALERIDLTPAKISALPDWEKEMAEKALEKSRELRHRLENVQNMGDLEQIAADVEEYYRHLNREWSLKRIEKCPSCQINSNEEVEIEPEKHKASHYQYGSKVSEARMQLLEEIRHARGEE